VNALGELDDCLTMVHLFGTVPAIADKKIDVDLGQKCRKYVLFGNIIYININISLPFSCILFLKVQCFSL
jgi:hypothetical protein